MNTYSLVLALHVISIATWMIMLVYLPKLFVYHLQTPQHAQTTIVLQENSLYKVGTMAMIFSIKFGLILLYLNPNLLNSGGWLHLKLALAAFMVVYHFTCKKFIHQFEKEGISQNLRFLRFFRMLPEITTALIIFLAIVKPF